MQIRYFDTAWSDIKNSPGWFGKLCLLALVNLIPIFGSIVTYGYLYGWAREISWGAHRPLPEKIFNNDDGKFWRRGWFAFVIVFVFTLVPSIVMSVGQSMRFSGMYSSGMYTTGAYSVAATADVGVASLFGGLLYFVGVILSLLVGVLAWIGIMRMSIYDRLSAGFQLSKLWKMLRHDTNGIVRIFGMNLLVSLIVGVVLSIVIFAFAVIIVFAGMAGLASTGYPIGSYQDMTDAQSISLILHIVMASGVVGFLCLLIILFAAALASLFTEMLVARAMGYWTMQFDVPRWRGQDDPMPFEMVAAAPGVMPGTAPGMSQGMTSGMSQGVAQQGMPGVAPGVAPGAAPGATQQGMPNGQPFAQPYGQPSTDAYAQAGAQPNGMAYGQMGNQPNGMAYGQMGVQPNGVAYGQAGAQPDAQPYGQVSSQVYGQMDNQPYGQTEAQPYTEAGGQPYAQSQVQPIGQPLEQPVVEPFEQPAEWPAVEPLEQPVEWSAAEPFEQPIEASAVDQPVEWQAVEPFEQLADLSAAEQPQDQQMEQIQDQLTEQPQDQPAQQPHDQA